MKFELGDKTKDIWCGELVRRIGAANWCGELVRECEFICHMDNGLMLFFDLNSKCFRRVYWVWDEKSKKFILSGWKCANSISELIK